MKKLLLLAAVVTLAACEPKTGPVNAAPAKPGTSSTHEAVPGAPQPGRVDPQTVPLEMKLKASRGAKPSDVYTNALAAVYAPEDAKSYSPYSEYGWKNSMDYKTYGPMPAGWWVYAQPYWVVWDLKNGQRGE